MPYRWKEDPNLKVQELVWREDMATFVNEILRRSIVRDLKYLASRPAAYVIACESYDSITAHEQIAAVLWLGSNSGALAQGSHIDTDDLVDAGERGPSPYAVYETKGRYVPFLNLVALLERTHLYSLQEACPAQLGAPIAIIKGKRPTVKFQMQLWKLLGFLAQPTE